LREALPDVDDVPADAKRNGTLERRNSLGDDEGGRIAATTVQTTGVLGIGPMSRISRREVANQVIELAQLMVIRRRNRTRQAEAKGL